MKGKKMQGMFDYIEKELKKDGCLFEDPKETKEEVQAAKEICQFVAKRKDENAKIIRDDLPLNTSLFNSHKKREEGGIIYVLLAIKYYLSKIDEKSEERKFLKTIQEILEEKRKFPLKDVKKRGDDLMAAIFDWLKLTGRTESSEDVAALRKTFVLLLRLSAIGITKLQNPVDGGVWANTPRLAKLNIAKKLLGNLDIALSRLDDLQSELISFDSLTKNETIADHAEMVQKTVIILTNGVGNDSIDKQLLPVVEGIKKLNKEELNLKKEAMQDQKKRAETIINIITKNSRLVSGQKYFVDLIMHEEIGGRKGLEQFLLEASDDSGYKKELKKMLEQYDNPSNYRRALGLGQYITSWVTTPVTLGFRQLAPNVVQRKTNALITTLDSAAKSTLLQLAQAELKRVDREIREIEALISEQLSEDRDASKAVPPIDMHQLVQKLVKDVEAIRERAIKNFCGEKSLYIIKFLIILERFIPSLFDLWVLKKEKAASGPIQDSEKLGVNKALSDCRTMLKEIEKLQEEIKKQSLQGGLEGVSISSNASEKQTAFSKRFAEIKKGVDKIEESVHGHLVASF